MASVIPTSPQASAPVTPKPTVSTSSNVERQVIAEQAGQAVPFVSQSEETQQTRSGSQSDSNEYDLKEAVSNLNDYVQNLERNLSFSVDEVSGKTVITVTDPENDEVIRQIPSEDLLAVARHYAELRESEGKGVLIEEQV
jgi:flagellar protein FlaG